MEASDPQTEPPLQGVEVEAAGAAGPDPHTAAWDRLIACNTKVTHTINTRPPHRCLMQDHGPQHRQQTSTLVPGARPLSAIQTPRFHSAA